MARLYKQKGSSNWYLGCRVGPKEIRKTTGTSDEAVARQQLEQIEALFAANKSAANLESVFQALVGKTAPRRTLMLEINAWVDESKQTTRHATFAKYQATAQALLKAVGATEKSPMLVDVTTDQLQRYLGARLKETSPATANLDRKVLRVFFKRVLDRGLIRENPMAAIKPFKGARRNRRRDFSKEEMMAIYAAAPNDFWRYMIMGGFYTGMRLGDLTTLRIEEVDFERAMINRETDKVEGRFIHIPIVPKLLELIRKQAGNRTHGFLWPEMAAKYEPEPGRKRSGWFSHAFYDILATVKIVDPRKRAHHTDRELPEGANGRAMPRNINKVSFHSLRHTFVSMLKKTGASQTIAKELAGHSTDAISNLYTHTSAEDLKAAVEKLPEFTA